MDVVLASVPKDVAGGGVMSVRNRPLAHRVTREYWSALLGLLQWAENADRYLWNQSGQHAGETYKPASAIRRVHDLLNILPPDEESADD